MTGQELLSNVYTTYRGKIAPRTPAWGSDKANVVLSIANLKIREWASDPRNKWNSLFVIEPVGTLSTGTLSYDLDESFFMSSDYARIVKTDGSIYDVPIVKAQQRNVSSSQSIYIHGQNPKMMTFSQALDAGLDGATLYAPGYYFPDPIVSATDIVPVDDPNWLVYIVASELARNDPSKEDNFPTLVGMANEFYSRMSNANNDVGFAQPNSIVNLMPQISPDLDEDWTL